MTTSVPRASAEERERLAFDFVRLCEIESPSLQERAVAEAVAAELRAAGLEVEEDASADAVGSQCGNLIARIPAPEGARTVLLCAHLDTVPLAAPVNVQRDGGVFRNANDAILGADNKAAVAVLLGVARRLAAQGSPVGVELLFTTAEELALRGAKEVDRSALESEFGFVFDHASPIGEIIVAAPTYYRIEARFRGVAAHAGIRPEAGRNAIVAAAQGALAHADRAAGRGHHGQRRDDRGRHGRQRGGRARPSWDGGAQPRRRRGGACGERDGGRLHRGRERHGVRRRDHGRAAVPRLPAAAHRTAGARRGRRLGVARDRARSTCPPAAGAMPTP